MGFCSISFNPGGVRNVYMHDKDGNVAEIKPTNVSIEGTVGGPANVKVEGFLGTVTSPSDNKHENTLCFFKDPNAMAYERIVFNPPATVVLWKDGTKTVVRCDERDLYDPKYGLALCFMKKALGNRSRALNDVLHAVQGQDDYQTYDWFTRELTRLLAEFGEEADG